MTSAVKHFLHSFFITLLLGAGIKASAATVDTANTYSAAMHKSIKAVVVQPDNYNTGKRYPVIYLLHGYGGSYKDWVKNAPAVKTLADQYQFIVVCPDGNVGSWYLDSPVDTKWKYETYVIKELIPWVDEHYHTIADRAHRGITGLSMGGHGALYLSIRHQDVFGVAGSTSGGVDFRPFPKKWQLADRLGGFEEHHENWDKNVVVNQLSLLEPGKLALIIDCGVDDFFFNVNNQLHQLLLDKKIAHDYITRPGAHNWKYWSNSVKYQFLFMHDYFEQTLPQ